MRRQPLALHFDLEGQTATAAAAEEQVEPATAHTGPSLLHAN